MTQSPCASAPSSCLVLPKILLLLAIALIGFKALAFFYLGGAKLIWDSHWYLALAKNLAASGNYTLGDGEFHAKYPPGFPLFIGALAALVGNFETAAALLVWLSSMLLCLLTFVLGSRSSVSSDSRCATTGLLAAALFAIHHLSLIHANLILTEQLFSLLALCSIGLGARPSRRAGSFACAILLAGIASLVRYEGLLVFPVLAWCWSGARRDDERETNYAVFFSAALVVLAWALWVSALVRHGAPAWGGLYGQELARASIDRALDFSILALWLGPCFLFLALAGASKILRRSNRPALAFGLFAALYFACHVCWWFSDIRFYVVLLPLLSICAARSIVGIARRINCNSTYGRAVVVLSLLCLVGAEQLEMSKAANAEYRQFNSLYLKRYDLIKEVTAWANLHLGKATFAVPEVPVYSHYLGSSRVVPYSELSGMLAEKSGTAFAIIDTMHFRNEALQSALSGFVTVTTPSGEQHRVAAKVLFKSEGHLTPDDDRYAAVIEISPAL